MSKNVKHVKIDLAAAEIGTRIWIEGVEQIGVKSVELRHAAGSLPTLVLEFNYAEGSIEGEALIDKINICALCASKMNTEN